MQNKMYLLCLLWVLLVVKGIDATLTLADECECKGATLACIRDDNQDSTNGKCPPCPTSCPATVDECRDTSCGIGEECVIADDVSHTCVADIVEGGVCSYTKNCVNRVDCNIAGERNEIRCATGLFCRATETTKDCIIGTCVSVATSTLVEEARCLKDGSVDASRCSIDGDYKCSITEDSDDGNTEVQTCYHTATGRVLMNKTLDVAKGDTEIDCRDYYDKCTSASERKVLHGELVQSPDDICKYCECKDGVIDTTQCERKMDCIDFPADCTNNGITVPHGETITINGCVQKRCYNGGLSGNSLDANCDGRDDVNTCADEVDSPVVCVRSGSIRARVPKCKALTADSSANTDCDENFVCGCEGEEICLEDIRPVDLCVDATATGTGCKPRRCMSKNTNVECEISADNTPVCSAQGETYNSHCEAIINTVYAIKYLRACEDCLDGNDIGGYCGYDKRTYSSVCGLERITGNTLRDYEGSCNTDLNEAIKLCKEIPAGCDFATKAEDATCPKPGGQGVLHIDTTEAVHYAFSKGKEDLDLNDLREAAESDWTTLTGFPLKDDKCEFTVRANYKTIGALVVNVKAETGQHCATCGERIKVYLDILRETKSYINIEEVSRKRRQSDGSESSGIFINPAELENDPLFHNGAYNIVASTLLILTSVILATLLF